MGGRRRHGSRHPDRRHAVVAGLATQAVTLRQSDRRPSPDLAGYGPFAIRHPATVARVSDLGVVHGVVPSVTGRSSCRLTSRRVNGLRGVTDMASRPPFGRQVSSISSGQWKRPTGVHYPLFLGIMYFADTPEIVPS